MRGLVETLNEAKMPVSPIVVSLYARESSDSRRSLATIVCESSYFTSNSLEDAKINTNFQLQFIPGKEDEFWEMIGADEFPFADMLSFEWRNNLALAYRDRYNKVEVYLVNESFLYRDIALRKNDIKELQTELKYMQKIVKIA